MTIEPEVFPEPPLDPISSARVPYFFADSDPQSYSALRAPEHPHIKMGGPIAAASSEHLPEIRRPPDSVFPSQPKRMSLIPTAFYALWPSVG